MNPLLLCSVLVSFAWVFTDLLAFWSIPADKFPTPVSLGEITAEYFLGVYLGILTFVPLGIAIRDEVISARSGAIWNRLSDSRLVLESIAVLLPALAFLCWFASQGKSDVNEAARMAMFLPVAWLSLRHGWQGAALGGSLASIAAIVSMPNVHDKATMQAQVFIGFTITTMLLLGGRIAALHKQEVTGAQKAKAAVASAQRTIFLGEMQLRRTSQALRQVAKGLMSANEELVRRACNVVPDIDKATEAGKAGLQVHQLADSLYPLTLQESGLLMVLRHGAIAKMLKERGIAYECADSGRSPETLSQATQIALFRLAFDVVVYLCAKLDGQRVKLRLRVGNQGGREFALLSVSVFEVGERVESHALPLLSASANTGGLAELRDRVSIFEGTARLGLFHGGKRLSLILFDPQASRLLDA